MRHGSGRPREEVGKSPIDPAGAVEQSEKKRPADLGSAIAW